MFTASLQISQSGDCDRFTVTDASSYSSESKGTFSARSLIVYRADGTVYRQPGQTTDAISFGYAQYPTDSINILGLDSDQAFTVVMSCTSNAPQAGSTYAATTRFALTCFTMSAFYDRHKKQAIQPRYEQNNNYVTDTHRLLVEKEGAVRAASNGDIMSAQLALDRAKKIIDNNKIPY